MECTVRWHEGMSFVAETGSGHMVCMDGAPEGADATSPRAPWNCCWRAPEAARLTISC
jgi:uncharacterized OsmC-like protein